MRYKGCRVAVTGAGSGIGAGIAGAFAAEGARVAYMDLDGSRAAEQAARAGADCFAVPVDVTDKASVDAAFAAAAQRLGGLDVLVCCAGVSYILPFLEHTEAIWDTTLNVNLKGTFLCLQAAVRIMRPQGKGCLLCLSSQSGKAATGSYQAYCASKAGVISLVQSVAVEFAPLGIRANVICPGVVHTPMWDKQLADYGKKRGLAPEQVMPYFVSKIPLGRIGTIEDVAQTALFLAGDEASYYTGQVLNVSGGSIMF